MVATKASTPPSWHTTTLFLWLLQVKLESMPAAQVTMLTSLLRVSSTKWDIRLSKLSNLVPASDRFLNVHRQFWTKRMLGWFKWTASACMPPASTMAVLLLEHTDSTGGIKNISYIFCKIKIRQIDTMHKMWIPLNNLITLNFTIIFHQKNSWNLK